MRILHLSDTHLSGDPERRYNGVVDTHASLSALLAAHDAIEGIDVVVVSGDLSDDGTPTSYHRLFALVDPWASARGAAVVYALGNHDDRDGFAAARGDDRAAGSPSLVSTDVAGWRILSVDSTAPGDASWGVLDDPSLAWLADRAQEPGRTVVVLHHPPIAAVSPLHGVIGLQNPDAFWSAIAGSDVRLVLAGHWHHQLVDTTAAVPVIVTPGGANRTDVLAGPHHERSVVATGASIIDLTDHGFRVTATDIPGIANRGDELFDVSDDVLATWIEKLGPR